MGHLGFLQKYINYYSELQDERIIGIWPDNCVNPYFLTKIIDSSPIEIRCFPGNPPKSFPDMRQVDSLIFSRVRENSWRFELSAASFSGQTFPESGTSPGSFLKIFPEEDVRAELLQKKLGMDKKKWFVCLHVRESTNGFSASGQNRDADISTYLEFCKQIQELGGQVIRMGDPSFPALPHGYPAIDYAHSEYRSNFFDTWLWGRCRWWTGTQNGPSFAAMALGTPRLITNQWFWDINGPSYDMWLPQLLIDNRTNHILTPSQTIAHTLSRSMSREQLHSHNLKLRSNSPEELRIAAIEMFQVTQFRQKNDLRDPRISISEFDRNFSTLMRVPAASSTIPISKNFSEKWQANELDFH
jgi:putative glycosyltransferase (TIGR04372 family)